MRYILTAEGKIEHNAGTFAYQYFHKDHLGNTRVTYKQNGEIVQTADYYPFGLRHEPMAMEDAGQKYLYNGKELQPELGWLDYGARMYDPAIARWHVVDPKAEEAYDWTPFRYAFNNPLKFIDPDGMLEDWWVDGEDGSLIYTADDHKPEGEKIEYLGKDGMFGEQGEVVEKSVKESFGENGGGRIDVKWSAELAESVGLSPIKITENEKVTQTSTHPDAGSSPIVMNVTISDKTTQKITYLPTEIASEKIGTTKTLSGPSETITPIWSFSNITNSSTTTYTYSAPIETPKNKVDVGKAISTGKFIYDIVDILRKL